MSSRDAAKRPKPKRGTGERQPRAGSARKTAVITGVTGQDGSYLAELLRREGLNFGMQLEETPGGEIRIIDPGSAPLAQLTGTEEE